jgi:RNA polymerase sigma factor (sigma-70 family)
MQKPGNPEPGCGVDVGVGRGPRREDVTIVERAASAGPATAFDDFYAARWTGAFRLAALLTHDTEAGADIAQDVFAAMSRRWASIERPDAYLQRALTNACANYRRGGRRAARKLHLLAVSDDGGSEPAVDGIADAVARLPFRQRAVIVLRYYADLSEAEIAAALACRPGTVKSLASRALDALSEEVAR